MREILDQVCGGENGSLELVAHVDGDARVAYEREHLVPKGHFVPPYNPAHENHGEGVKGHKGRVDGPFVLHPSCIKNDEARNTLESDQAASRQLPRVVALVQPVWVEDRVYRLRHVYSAGKEKKMPVQGRELALSSYIVVRGTVPRPGVWQTIW